jgi:hypothetical protein
MREVNGDISQMRKGFWSSSVLDIYHSSERVRERSRCLCGGEWMCDVRYASSLSR